MTVFLNMSNLQADIFFSLSADFILMISLIVCCSAWQPTLWFDPWEHRIQWGECVMVTPASRKWHHLVLQRRILECHTQSEPNHTRALCHPVQPAEVCALPNKHTGRHTGRLGKPHEWDPEHHHTGGRWVFGFNRRTLCRISELFFLFRFSLHGEFIRIWLKIQKVLRSHLNISSFLQILRGLHAGN